MSSGGCWTDHQQGVQGLRFAGLNMPLGSKRDPGAVPNFGLGGERVSKSADLFFRG